MVGEKNWLSTPCISEVTHNNNGDYTVSVQRSSTNSQNTSILALDLTVLLFLFFITNDNISKCKLDP